MRKTELVAKIAENTGVSVEDTSKVVAAFVQTVKDALKAGDKVQLIGFGTFDVAERPARKGRNPFTGEDIDIKASKAPRFKAGKAFKDSLN